MMRRNLLLALTLLLASASPALSFGPDACPTIGDWSHGPPMFSNEMVFEIMLRDKRVDPLSPAINDCLLRSGGLGEKGYVSDQLQIARSLRDVGMRPVYFGLQDDGKSVYSYISVLRLTTASFAAGTRYVDVVRYAADHPLFRPTLVNHPALADYFDRHTTLATAFVNSDLMSNTSPFYNASRKRVSVWMNPKRYDAAMRAYLKIGPEPPPCLPPTCCENGGVGPFCTRPRSMTIVPGTHAMLHYENGKPVVSAAPGYQLTMTIHMGGDLTVRDAISADTAGLGAGGNPGSTGD